MAGHPWRNATHHARLSPVWHGLYHGMSLQVIIIIIFTYSVLRRGNSLFQSEISRECGLMLRLSRYNITSFPQGHTTLAAYVFFLIFLSLLSFFLSSFLPSKTLQSLLGPGIAQKVSIPLYIELFLPILVFVGSVIHPSGRGPPILFLVFFYLSYRHEKLELGCRWYNYQLL